VEEVIAEILDDIEHSSLEIASHALEHTHSN
jgi:hypothetical protein